jgi:hypothetical protein
MTPEEVRAETIKCAESLRTRASAATHYLANPVECPALGSASAFTPLIAWALFNPFGPTICALHLVAVPDSSDRIIFFRWLNPFATGATAYGIVPDSVARDPKRLLPTLIMIFDPGRTSTAPVMPALPTHVSVPAESPLKLEQAREVVLTAANGTDSKSLTTRIDRLKAYRGDPWKRTAVERDETFALLGKGAPPAPAPSATPATRQQLEQWWVLVTDPVHVQSEVRELPRAWDGAIKFQERMKQK